MTSRHVSTVVGRPAAEVYAFASDLDNLPRWAAGLATGLLRRDGRTLVLDSALGEITVTFADVNEHGVLDHDVTLPSGEVVQNPFRVLAHPDGTELVFTVRQLDLTDDELDRDAAAVAADLATLKGLLEA
nr:SRPBCC family protein [Luteimicrobium subarcticum]